MFSIYHSGYGYSKVLCEVITSWFLSQFFPRHHVSVDIIHRGLKKDQVLGYCDVVGPSYRPRHFLIELQTDMSRELYIKTLFHELTHVAQWIRGDLRFRHGKMSYCQQSVEDIVYEDRGHDIEAREEEERLYLMYLNDRFGVPAGELDQFNGTRARHLL